MVGGTRPSSPGEYLCFSVVVSFAVGVLASSLSVGEASTGTVSGPGFFFTSLKVIWTLLSEAVSFCFGLKRGSIEFSSDLSVLVLDRELSSRFSFSSLLSFCLFSGVFTSDSTSF